jgi:hypothetical protein
MIWPHQMSDMGPFCVLVSVEEAVPADKNHTVSDEMKCYILTRRGNDLFTMA